MYARKIFPAAVACNGVWRPVQSTLRADAREMVWWMMTASSLSSTASVTVSLVCSLRRSQTGLAQRRMSRSALTALASSTNPNPSLYFSVAASSLNNHRSLNVVSRRYAVDLWISSSLETSVTPDHPRRDKNSMTVTALSTDCTEELLRTTAHISEDPTPPSVSSSCRMRVHVSRAAPPVARPVGPTGGRWVAPAYRGGRGRYRGG